MDEQPAHAPTVPEPDRARVAAAAQAVLAQFDQLQQQVGHRPEILARVHAGNAIRADDDHGRALGLVIQADEMRWSELEQLARLAGSAVDAREHAGVGTWHQDCPACQAALAVARIRAHQQDRATGPHDRPVFRRT